MKRPKQTTLEQYGRRIDAVQQFLRQHWDRPLRLAELAEVARLSPYHFHRIYRGLVGETVLDSQRRLRLAQSARLLRAGDRRVTDIAFAVGYESSQAFARAFQTEFGMSPTTFRRRGEALIDPFYLPPARLIGEFAMQIEIITLPAQHALCVRHVGAYHQVGPAFARLFGWLEQQGLNANGCATMSYDDPAATPVDQLRSDACALLDGPIDVDEADIEYREIAAGRFARYRHVGPYQGIESAYQRLFGEWLPQSGEDVADRPCIERYLNDAATTPPADLQTDLYLPLAGGLKT